MSITRTAIVDDDGTGTTGTVLNNAWKQELYDQIDSLAGLVLNGLCDGRVTLTSGTPVTTTDVTGATSLYFTPMAGNRIALYSSGAWVLRSFSELTQALGTLVAGQAYDVFAYDNSGTVALELAEWASATITMTIATPGVVTWTAHGLATGNSVSFTTTGALPTGVSANTVYYVTVLDANTFKLSTTLATLGAGTFIATSGSQSGTHTGHSPNVRQTALTWQDGVLVKTGATTRRYLATFVTTSTTTTEDSLTTRYLWNYYHRAQRPLRRLESNAFWTYGTAAWRQANASPANQLAWVIGVEDQPIPILVTAAASNGSAGVTVGSAYQLDGVTTLGANIHNPTFFPPVAGIVAVNAAVGKVFAGIGPHVAAWIEYSGSGTTTFQGSTNNCGITADLWG